MGFWSRLLNREQATQGAAAKLRNRADFPTPVADLEEDPRERARALHASLDLAREFDFRPSREITLDEVPFDRLGGIDAFNAERLTTLLNLTDEQGHVFPRVLTFEYDFVDSNDAYARVVREIAGAAGTADQLGDIHCDLHFGPDFHLHPLGELQYTFAGREYSHAVSSEGDWADPAVIAAIFDTVTPEHLACLSTEDGGHNYWVPTELAERFNTLLLGEQQAARQRKKHWQLRQQNAT